MALFHHINWKKAEPGDSYAVTIGALNSKDLSESGQSMKEYFWSQRYPKIKNDDAPSADNSPYKTR